MKRMLLLPVTGALAAALAGCSNPAPSTNSSTASHGLPPAPANSQAVAGTRTSYADVVSRVAPAVVTIHSSQRVRMPQQYPFYNDDMLRQFFGQQGYRMQPPQQQIKEGLGSGVIITGDGYILTNHHVVDGAEDIRVDLADRRSLKATVVGSDPPSDLAVLKIDATDLPNLTLADSDSVRVGDLVLAIGNPLGVGQTVTMGIISAKGRSTGLSDGAFEDFLQTDAPINQGNSGGALVSTAGELIGINSQILTPSGGNIGIGFAIPANMARNVADQLIKSGKVQRGMLGVTIQPVTNDLAASLGLPRPEGALINEVQPDSPAGKAGLRQGDVILGVNGEQIADPNALRNRIAAMPPDQEVTVEYWRDGKSQTVKVKLAALQAQAAAEPQGQSNAPPTEQGEHRLGLGLAPLSPEIARQLNVSPDQNGVVVVQVDPQGAAAEAGVQRGDLIQQINHKPIRQLSDIQEALQASSGKPALLLLVRQGQPLFLSVRPD